MNISLCYIGVNIHKDDRKTDPKTKDRFTLELSPTTFEDYTQEQLQQSRIERQTQKKLSTNTLGNYMRSIVTH